jgi:hypothetical protein
MSPLEQDILEIILERDRLREENAKLRALVNSLLEAKQNDLRMRERSDTPCTSKSD